MVTPTVAEAAIASSAEFFNMASSFGVMSS
jgi:hypothetical protein